MKSFLKKRKKNLSPNIFTPDNIISAYIELPDGVNPIETIWHSSSIALDTEKICFIYSLADDGLYFIAAPAVNFLGKENYSTPLAAALPNNKEYKGNGAYICPIGSNLYAVIIKGDKSLSSFIGDKNSVMQFADSNPLYWVEKNTTPWQSLTQYIQADTVKLLTKISLGVFSTIIALGAATFYFKNETVLHAASLKEKENKMVLAQQQNVMQMNLNKDTLDNPILRHYLKLSKYVIKQNGRIINYEAKEHSVKYTVELPSTEIENLSFFGSNVNPVTVEDNIVIEKEENI